MTSRRLSAFVDAVAAGRRPKRFRADPHDAEVLRAAIALRAARPGEAAPSESFVSDLFQQLSGRASSSLTPATQAARPPGLRTGLAAVAAAAVLIGGTAVVTGSLNRPAAKFGVAVQAPDETALRTGTFQAARGQVLGQIVAYRGSPSWVFMHVDVPNYDGPIVCMLQVDNGSTVAFGTFVVHHGAGQFSKIIGDVNLSHLRGARLVTSAGSPVAMATFAA
ncbi:MAG: hypothetical protein QOG99_341 [Frankiales bacterium]|jgi:hypothetical protein|nr:hypothetical protein [Frankiales bacterium]